MRNFCVSLTSIPPRFDSLKNTLDSIYNQQIQPEKVFLNIPEKFKRFRNKNFDFNNLSKNYSNLELNKCEDFGPGTKLLGSLQKISKFDFVILVDDDHEYNNQMLKIFYEQAEIDLNKSYSFCVYDILDCKIGQGADGFLINTKHTNGMLKFYDKYVKDNPKLFLNDDLWISVYLNKILKINIESLFPLLKQSIFKRYKSIYSKHTQAGAIIETYSPIRKKARELKFRENCDEYSLLKKLTKNFTII